jgi:type II secretory pathway pseudopilin PulG
VRSDGFSLIEILVATGLVLAGVASLAQLVVVSAGANRIARTTSIGVLVAEHKMEELIEETGVGPSPPGTLSANTEGYVEYLDPSGKSLAIPAISLPPGSLPPGMPPPGTAYICRWSISLLPDSPHTAAVVQVLVTPWPDTAGRTRLVSVKTRKRT